MSDLFTTTPKDKPLFPLGIKALEFLFACSILTDNQMPVSMWKLMPLSFSSYVRLFRHILPTHHEAVTGEVYLKEVGDADVATHVLVAVNRHQPLAL